MYGSDDQAVERICSVLESDALQSSLQHSLAARSHDFTEQAFMRQLCDIVQTWVASNRSQNVS
jgi:hypothetical protein